MVKEDEILRNECKELISSLPRGNGWYIPYYYQYQGFWYPLKYLKGAVAFHQQFKPREGDAFLVTTPKAGTTWLKALAFAVVNRTRYLVTDHPLLNTGPHDLVPFVILKFFVYNQLSEFESIPSPRLLATHIPYTLLPESAIQLNCRVVYLCPNPRDTFTSMWVFLSKLRHESLGPLSLGEAFELFCIGVSIFGPYWDHVLGYWKASLERPERVLFLKWYIPYYCQYQGFWYPLKYLKGAVAFHQQFKPREGEAFLVTTPKSGTTWLKALAFAVVNRTRYLVTDHPLLNTGPHDLVPFFILKFFVYNQLSEFESIPSPRLLATHIPYTLLPESAIQSNCRVVYLCRNRRDTFTSMWVFFSKLRHERLGPLSLEEATFSRISINGGGKLEIPRYALTDDPKYPRLGSKLIGLGLTWFLGCKTPTYSEVRQG
ncbi:cytosolic sulfotransferase 15-like [Tasmannia lanceolata]|uniref:cytosolic sulfotransferase 15-like n=1 Tax=Tasmannia lanceolata TaxID=3420 RepID=UPI004063A93B